MPPGMCLCQFAPAVPPAKSVVVTPDEAAAVAPAEKTCCKRCVRHADAEPAGPSPAPRTAEPLQPAPPTHAPDCPVITGLSPYTAVLADSVGVEWCLPATVSADSVGAIDAGRTLVAAGPSPSLSPPLFISHCTLLI
jgi:hypothetical protein